MVGGGKPQPSESQPPTGLHPQGHPAALLTRLRTHCSTAGGGTLLETSRRTSAELSLLSAWGSATPAPGGQAHVIKVHHVIKQGGAFFLQPNEGEEIHSGALARILQKEERKHP